MIKKTKLILTTVVIFFLLLIVGFGFASGIFKPKYNNAIVIMIDTLRADHLGAYGYKRDTSPALDAFAKENVIAARAIAVAPWTPPSVASILTGLSVARHGHNPALMESQAKKKGELLRDEINTLPEILKSFGYQTAGVSSNPWITSEFNFDQGFDSFFYQRRSSTEVTLSAAREKLKLFASTPAKPFFLYMHILDPHGPHDPKGKYVNMFSGRVEGAWPYDENAQAKVNNYDAEIRSVDDQLGEFFAELKSSGLYDKTEIIVVSDHGEQFDEHGDWGHGKMLHIEEVHVPFLVKCTGNKGRVEAVVSNMDVTPTLLDCLNIDVNTKFDGISILDAEKLEARAGTFSSVRRAYVQEAFTTKDGMRIINSKGRAKSPLKDWEVKGTYNLETDPMETSPAFDPATVSELRGYLDSAKSALTPQKEVVSPSREVSKDSMEQLESLGYINE